MSTEVNIHGAQTAILRELLFRPKAGYAELQRPTGLSSDHFNFHIARLVGLGLVEKLARGSYRMTNRGKEYANKLDTDHNTIERQPKSAVLLGVEKLVDGVPHYLFQERLKHPWYGFWGILGGKIRWGETILQCAARELLEETGLQADLRHRGIYHEHTFETESGEMLEDKIFHVVHCTNPTGELIERFEGGRNVWLTETAARQLEKRFDSFETEFDMFLGKGRRMFVERATEYSRDQF